MTLCAPTNVVQGFTGPDTILLTRKGSLSKVTEEPERAFPMASCPTKARGVQAMGKAKALEDATWGWHPPPRQGGHQQGHEQATNASGLLAQGTWESMAELAKAGRGGARGAMGKRAREAEVTTPGTWGKEDAVSRRATVWPRRPRRVPSVQIQKDRMSNLQLSHAEKPTQAPLPPGRPSMLATFAPIT